MIIQVKVVGIRMNKKNWLLVCLLVLIDQASKLLALNLLNYNVSVPVISNFFYFTLVKNIGASFSILSGYVSLLIIVSIFAFLFIVRYLNKKKNMKNTERFSYCLVLSGLLGNLIDRMFRNGVIDFLDFKIFGYDYPIFNIADIFIVWGIFILIFLEFRSGKDDFR